MKECDGRWLWYWCVSALLLALQVSDDDNKSPRQISRTVHDTLADIFKKIGSKENTREVCSCTDFAQIGLLGSEVLVTCH